MSDRPDFEKYKFQALTDSEPPNVYTQDCLKINDAEKAFDEWLGKQKDIYRSYPSGDWFLVNKECSVYFKWDAKAKLCCFEEINNGITFSLDEVKKKQGIE